MLQFNMTSVKVTLCLKYTVEKKKNEILTKRINCGEHSPILLTSISIQGLMNEEKHPEFL